MEEPTVIPKVHCLEKMRVYYLATTKVD